MKNEYDSNDQYEINIQSLEEYRTHVNKIREEKGWDYVVDPIKLVLDKEYDLFIFELDGMILISENLKNSIETSDFSGISIEPYKFEFEIN